MKILQGRVSTPQRQLIYSTAKFPAFVGGFGSGKTHALIYRALRYKWMYPKQNIGYYLPTVPLIKDIAFERFPEILEKAKIRYRLNQTDKYIKIPGKGKLIFRSMMNPDTIIGYEHAHFLADELDTLSMDKARKVWQKIIARNRQLLSTGHINTGAVGTTPEGFKFVYESWHKKPVPGYELIRASTYSNQRNLQPDYIDSLKAIYPANLLQAYLDGLFVNLVSGTVYYQFDRKLNHTDVSIDEKDTLHIGMDFNVLNMSGIVHVFRDGHPCAVNELLSIRDTPAMCTLIKERYQSKGHRIIVYPDATGGSKKSINASESDISIIKSFGFRVDVGSKNPFVKDRVQSVNAKICNIHGERTYLVNTMQCPELTLCLEQQSYDKNGEPDKTQGHDHPVDAAGYFVYRHYPINKPKATVTGLRL